MCRHFNLATSFTRGNLSGHARLHEVKPRFNLGHDLSLVGTKHTLGFCPILVRVSIWPRVSPVGTCSAVMLASGTTSICRRISVMGTKVWSVRSMGNYFNLARTSCHGNLPSTTAHCSVTNLQSGRPGAESSLAVAPAYRYQYLQSVGVPLAELRNSINRAVMPPPPQFQLSPRTCLSGTLGRRRKTARPTAAVLVCGTAEEHDRGYTDIPNRAASEHPEVQAWADC